MDLKFRMATGAVDADTHVVELQGELDLAAAPHVRAALAAALEAGRRFVVVDLGEVSYVDSSTLSVMLAAQRQLATQGGRIVTVCSPFAAHVFEIAGLTQVLGVTRSRREALSQAQDFPAAA